MYIFTCISFGICTSDLWFLCVLNLLYVFIMYVCERYNKKNCYVYNGYILHSSQITLYLLNFIIE